MLEPDLPDSDLQRRQTDIYIDDAELAGGGVGLGVLLHAFANTDYTWFTLWNRDSFFSILIAVDDQMAESLPQLPYGENEYSPIKDAIGDEPYLQFREYKLTDEVRLRIGADEQFIGIERRDLIKYEVYFADYRAFGVEPYDINLLRRVISVVLRQHSFYLGREVDWSPALEDIVNTTVELRRISMISDPATQNLIITRYDPPRRIIERLLGKRRERPIKVISVEGGIARFLE